MPTRNPSADLEYKTFEYGGETYRVKTKFKIFKFFKTLKEDPTEAIEMIVEPEDFARLEELDLTMDDFKDVLEAASQAMAGTSSGN